MKSSIQLFGKRIKELRKRQGLTQEKLSEIMEVDPKTINRLENGYSFITYENLEKLASALNVEIKDFFDFQHLNNKETLQKYIIKTTKELPTAKLQKLAKFVRDYL